MIGECFPRQGVRGDVASLSFPDGVSAAGSSIIWVLLLVTAAVLAEPVVGVVEVHVLGLLLDEIAISVLAGAKLVAAEELMEGCLPFDFTQCHIVCVWGRAINDLH
jgi:hypothetical protein